MPVLPLRGGHVTAETNGVVVLAVHGVRSGVASRSTPRRLDPGKEHPMAPLADTGCAHARDVLADLYRLIEALDRRVPRLERLGEAQIAHDAADLRERALSLIRRIEGDAPME
jgi:hypothetical protein